MSRRRPSMHDYSVRLCAVARIVWHAQCGRIPGCAQRSVEFQFIDLSRFCASGNLRACLTGEPASLGCRVKREDGALPGSNSVTAPATVNEDADQNATAPRAWEGDRHGMHMPLMSPDTGPPFIHCSVAAGDWWGFL